MTSLNILGLSTGSENETKDTPTATRKPKPAAKPRVAPQSLKRTTPSKTKTEQSDEIDFSAIFEQLKKKNVTAAARKTAKTTPRPIATTKTPAPAATRKPKPATKPRVAPQSLKRTTPSKTKTEQFDEIDFSAIFKQLKKKNGTPAARKTAKTTPRPIATTKTPAPAVSTRRTNPPKPNASVPLSDAQLAKLATMIADRLAAKRGETWKELRARWWKNFVAWAKS